MKAQAIRDHLKSLDSGWVHWNDTVDTFKAGDPETEVAGIAVGWMNYADSLKRAVELGCNVFVCHEPLYYNHRDNDSDIFRVPYVAEKRRWVEESGLVILRCHDLWDQVKDIGIPDSWGRLLGFGTPIAGEGWFRVYDGSGKTSEEVARQIAARTATLGQDAVQLIGPGDARVSRVVIGTGAITPFFRYLADYQPDLAVCTDDGFTYWRDGALAIDMGFPVVVVNHAVSEIYGIQCLAEHLAKAFPNVPVHFIPQRCMFRLVHDRTR